MKRLYCYNEGYCYIEENGKIEVLTPIKQKSVFVGVGTTFLGILTLALYSASM